MAISGFCRQISFRNAHFFEQRFYFFKFFRIHRFRGNVRPQKFEKLFFTGADIVAVAEIEIKMNGRSGKIKHRIDPLIKVVCTEYGFNDVITYTDSESMFEDLWQEWLDTRLYLFAKGTPMLEMGYEEIFKCLPEEKQKELLEQKAVFAKMAEIELK